MKKAFLAATLVSICSVAFAITMQGPNTLVLTDEEAAACKAEGGCIVVTKKAFIRVVEDACQSDEKNRT